jgi:AraC family transcriptional regulator
MTAYHPFEPCETHGILSGPGVDIAASSEHLGWMSIYASAQCERPFAGHFRAVQDQLLVMHLDGPVAIEGRRGDVPFRKRVPAGAIHLIPGGADFDIALAEPLQTLRVYIRHAVLVSVAARMTNDDPTSITIDACLVENDRTLVALLAAVHLALEARDEATPLYMDFLS